MQADESFKNNVRNLSGFWYWYVQKHVAFQSRKSWRDIHRNFGKKLNPDVLFMWMETSQGKSDWAWGKDVGLSELS